MATDRTVHARTASGDEIVRYDRAGKWFVEFARFGRRQISLGEAVALAVEDGAEWFAGRPGGSRFDDAVRVARGGAS